jgi:hypothetical protein
MLTVLSSHVTSVRSRKTSRPNPPHHRPGGHPTTTSGRSGHAVTRWSWRWRGWMKTRSKSNWNLSFFPDIVSTRLMHLWPHFIGSSPQVPPGGLAGTSSPTEGTLWKGNSTISPRGVWETWPQRRSFPPHTDTATTPTTTATTLQWLDIKRSNKTLTFLFHRQIATCKFQSKSHRGDLKGNLIF